MLLSHRGNDALLLLVLCLGQTAVKEATGFLNPSPLNRAFHGTWATTTTTISSAIPATPFLSYSRLETTTMYAGGAENEEEEEEDDEDDVDVLLDETVPMEDIKGAELAWRYAKKPLLRIGVKGATMAHGNSLRQLLEAHTVVKVKVNTMKFGESLVTAFGVLRDLAVENGAPSGIELIQAREKDKTILLGLPGTMAMIERGEFPPPPPPPYIPTNAKE